MSATHKETKQFFTLYNTLDDKKVYLEKEVSEGSTVNLEVSEGITVRPSAKRSALSPSPQVNLLNSIHDNFQQ